MGTPLVTKFRVKTGKRWLTCCSQGSGDGVNSISMSKFWFMFEMKQVDQETLGPWAGTQDRAGADIFHGDIIRLRPGVTSTRVMLMAVICDQPDWLLSNNGSLDFMSNYNSEEIERVGNIWDNPGLVKVTL